MEVLDMDGWRFFVGDDSGFVEEKVGKWMYFFEDQNGRIFTEERCREAVEKEIVWEAKCSDSNEGVACFYLNIDDIERHKGKTCLSPLRKCYRYYKNNTVILRRCNSDRHQ